MSSVKKIKANRKNSKLSTGPKDTRNSRYNATKYGITSKQAVVPAVDGPDAAERFDQSLAGLRQYFSPQGPLEDFLVDQIALGMQQQRRLLAYENSVIAEQTEYAIDKLDLGTQIYHDAVESMEIEAALASLEEQDDLREVSDPTYLVRFIREGLGYTDALPLGEPEDTKSVGDREVDVYTPEQLQDLIDFACGQGQWSEEELRGRLKDFLHELSLQKEQDRERLDVAVQKRIGRASIPEDMHLDKIFKYDTRLSNRIHKSLHELQRLQARRIDGQPAATAAVDVSVAVDAPMVEEVHPQVDQSQEISAPTLEGRLGQRDRANQKDGANTSSSNEKELTEAGDPVPAELEAKRPLPLRGSAKGIPLATYLGLDRAEKEPRPTGRSARGRRRRA